MPSPRLVNPASATGCPDTAADAGTRLYSGDGVCGVTVTVSVDGGGET